MLPIAADMPVQLDITQEEKPQPQQTLWNTVKLTENSVKRKKKDFIIHSMWKTAWTGEN